MKIERAVAYVCSTAIVVTALVLGHDGQLAAIAVAAMLGIDKLLERIDLKKAKS